MQITETKLKVSDLCKNYSDNGDGGVYAYDGRTCVRPAYQREYVYKDKQRDEVIYTMRKGFPLGLLYWNKIGDDEYEVLDGQQRTISICQYINGDFAVKVNGNDKFFHNLSDTEKQQLLDYELMVFICEGTEEEKLEWFKVVNIAGEVLTNQELLNATYAGPWLADAKNFFSKRNCVAGQLGDGYIKGNPIRQELLEKVLSWIANRDGLESGQMYMAIHQHDADANELWIYYQDVITWAQRTFPNKRKGITDCQNWGYLYNRYHDRRVNSNTLEEEMQRLIMDDDVTKNAGIIPYLLSDRTRFDEKYLSIRAFTDAQKRRAYERQAHRCVCCGSEFDYDQMQGDHIIPWSQGGRTVDENLQMLCQKCNNDKSAQ